MKIISIKKIFAYCVLATTAFCLPLAHADNRPGAISLTLGGGYDFFAPKRQIRHSDVRFIALGYDFNQQWGIEATLGSFKTDAKPTFPANKRVSGTYGFIDGLYRFGSFYHIEPYALFGIGIIGMNPTRYDANNEANINGGFGAQFFIHRSIAFKVEGRDAYTMIGGKHDVLLDAGISILFDAC